MLADTRQPFGGSDRRHRVHVNAGERARHYQARIVTAEGTFLDRGTTYVHVDRFTTDTGFWC
jgi:hypothetical protein